VRAGIPCITTIEAAEAAAAAVASGPGSAPRALQDAGRPTRPGRAFRPGAPVA
jgi:carbamoyl-phosphate synthase large subunit